MRFAISSLPAGPLLLLVGLFPGLDSPDLRLAVTPAPGVGRPLLAASEERGLLAISLPDSQGAGSYSKYLSVVVDAISSHASARGTSVNNLQKANRKSVAK
jgi:hypothetical protein